MANSVRFVMRYVGLHRLGSGRCRSAAIDYSGASAFDAGCVPLESYSRKAHSLELVSAFAARYQGVLLTIVSADLGKVRNLNIE